MYDLLHFGGICSETKVSKKKAGADHSLKVQEFKLYSTKKKTSLVSLGRVGLLLVEVDNLPSAFQNKVSCRI